MTRASTASGARLRLLRQRRQVTVKGLARQLGVDPSFLRPIERGMVAVSAQLVRDISRVLETLGEPLLALAGHLPEDVGAILLAHPERSRALLRERLGPSKRRRSRELPPAAPLAAQEAR